MSAEPQYPDHFTKRLHILWGEGFLSPGGPSEIREIVSGIDLREKTVLDIGSGTGGAATVLAGECGALSVIGIDVEPQLVEQSKKLADKKGLSGKAAFKLVTPGPLPFGDAHFDVVFSKDALLHIKDKPGLFAEVLRVLKPGGVFAASDWLSGSAAEEKAALDPLLNLWHFKTAMATADEMKRLLAQSGFEKVSSRDRNAWYAIEARHEMSRIVGPLRQQLAEAAGEEILLRWIGVRKAIGNALDAGGLRPTHLRAFKPLH